MFSRLGQGEELGGTRDTKTEWSNVLVTIAALEITPTCIRSKQSLHLLKILWANKYCKKGWGRLLFVSHTFAIGCQPGLQSSEGLRLLDVHWLALTAVDTGYQVGAHLRLPPGAPAWTLSLEVSGKADFRGS